MQLKTLEDALTAEPLKAPLQHADATPMPMLNPGKSKTYRTNV